MSDSLLHPQESGLASLFAGQKNECRIVMAVALHKAILHKGRNSEGLIRGSDLVLGLCLAGNGNPTICWTSE